MTRRFAMMFAATSVLGFGLLLFSAPTRSNVVTPPGACIGTGTWLGSGQTESSAAHVPSDVVEIPAKDTVKYEGRIAGAPAVGPERPISGFIKLALPIGDLTIDSWGGTSKKYANSGQKAYDIPSAFKGIKLKLSGEHRDNGKLTCSGSVYLKVKGSGVSSPLGIASIGLFVISGGALVFAGRAH